jgi:OOP family OmpA-OmpF porin
VEVTEDKIVIHDKIQFEVDKAIIKPESFGLLDEIGAVITANPRIRRLSVEGHTDSTGSDGHNQQLSDARAHSVLEFLVQHGIAPDRLVSKGWGESKPLANNATAIGREHNRRVEFVIIEQSDIKRTYEIDPKTGERRLVAPPDAPASTSPQTKGPPEPEPEPEPEYDDRPETVL